MSETADGLRRAAIYLTAIEDKAKELHAASCAQRGEPVKWSGRRTNRAYYRRRAKPLVDALQRNAER